MEHPLFNIAYVFYSLSTLLYLLYVVIRKESLDRAATPLLAIGLVIHLVSLARGMMSPHFVPWSNWFESLSFFAAIVAVIFLAIEWTMPMPILGVFVMPISWSLMTYAALKQNSTQTLMPAMHSRWMAVHVPVMFASFSLLGVAFAVGIAYLLQEYQLKSKRLRSISYRLPPLEELDSLIYKLILAAFPLLTLGMVVGGLWAYDAWGRYWNWDPKETWTLVTWCIYAVYLGVRLIGGWRGRKTAYLSLAGFVLVIFTYAGVSYLSPLHSFLSGNPSSPTATGGGSRNAVE